MTADDYEQLLADPAVAAAVAMQREAERLWVVSADKPTDPQLWCALMTVIAFARAGGDCARVRDLTAGLSRDVQAPTGPLKLVEA